MMANLANEAFHVINLHKYLALKRRCEEIQLANEKLVNRIYNVKKILKRYKKERSALTDRLDALGDSYRDSYVPAMWAEGEGEASDEEGIPDEETDQAVASIPGFLQPKLESDALAIAGSSCAITVPKKGKKVKTASPYVLFCSHRKAALQQEHLQKTGEEPSRAELTKLLSLEWANIPQDQKQLYTDLAEKKKLEATQQDLPVTIKQEEIQATETLQSTQTISGLMADSFQ